MAIAGVGAPTEVTAGARTRLAENFDTFLTLLTTQLKNQDPLSPMDSNQFTQQMVQMTGVEQQLLTNDLLKQLVGNTNSGISTAVSLIGKEVRAVTDTTALKGGKADWVYKLDREAEEVKFDIVDASGKTVHTKTLTGDDAKAETLLKQALALNPDGIDPNYFYGDFLQRNQRYAEAKVALEKALQAPDRPGRASADAGRRAEAQQLLAEVIKKLE